ncbi:MAG: type 2 isopentenyl-diphosphate Delta-isomerase [Candidatus Methanomethylophilaceae archaeon]|jgi:isopentenyl-diphosphate delta-isomerase
MKNRKAEHIDICLNQAITPGYNYWNDVKLIHDALPEVDLCDIDTSTYVLGKKLDFPFIVTAITGGFEGAKKINANIAEACSELGIGMGIGSERATIEKVDRESYTVIKDYDIPLVIGNIGAPQLVDQKKKKRFSYEDVGKAKDLIDADFIAIHLNFLQEVIQPEGDTNAKGCYDAIRDLAYEYPIIVKETGAGISRRTAKRLSGTGIKAIDIAGMGGTSFSAVEMYRAEAAKNEIKTEMGYTYFDWGIPAPVSLLYANAEIPMIASGGINTGLDVARSISMGAVCAGGANVILKEAMESANAVKNVLTLIKEELKAAMLLTGSTNIKELSHGDYIVIGETRQWMDGLK